MKNQLISQHNETRAAIRCGYEVLERITQQYVDVARNTYLKAERTLNLKSYFRNKYS